MVVSDKKLALFKTHFKTVNKNLRLGDTITTTTAGHHGPANSVAAAISVATTQATILANRQSALAASELALSTVLARQYSLLTPSSTASAYVITNVSSITTPITHGSLPRIY
jgi:hypothetical protein